MALISLALIAGLVYQIPFVNDRLSWRLDELRTNFAYAINPPEEAVFVPQQQVDQMLQATLLASQPTITPSSVETVSPTATMEPLPPFVSLDGVQYVDQHGRWNYCGPANLTMALRFWGWQGDRDQVAEVVKPGENDTNLDFIQRGKKDKNVMPYEMEDFVNNYTEFASLTRIGGEIEMVKRLIANGFPVLIEKGYYEADYRGIVDWLGHYLFITGYDDSQGYFIVQDAYLKTGDNGTGANLRSSYEDFADQWRSFNYLFMVIYPPDRQDDVLAALGPWAETEWANRHALEIAQRESEMLSGINQFFAWYNLGSSHVSRFEYVDAANAYDYAFQLYAALDEETVKRPFRMIWYQTGPYFAYFYSGRYQDVIDLANRALYDWSSEPTLEESIYWRGMALLALGETDNAVADFQQSVYLNPNFNPGWAKLAELGFSQ